ncbi:MAG: oligopeptide transporter, OPT family, partial [Elusimicrobiales bacterium]|nr:oligopeptide transporter, OPT family [Elusimicrobiales bacterium]
MDDKLKKSGYEFKPYINDGVKIAEFTIQAAVLGLILSVIFNAANAYLGLKIGMTVSASIPSAIISMTVLRIILPRFFKRNATILENNIVHAFASIGESTAAAIIFTVPAILFLGGEFKNSTVFILGAVGGLMGLMMMIPLRHSLVVKEHKNLPFPEGTACAEVLIAGDKGGKTAKPVFIGIFVGGIFKFLTGAMKLFKDYFMWSFPSLNKAGFGYEISPLFLGVGYLVGLRIALIMFAGGAFGYWIIIPLINHFAGNSVIPPGTIPISEMTTDQIRANYVKYIGAGGVAFGGLISIIKSLPDIISSIKHTIKALVTPKVDSVANSSDKYENYLKDYEHRSIVISAGILGAIIGMFAIETPIRIGSENLPNYIRILFGVLIRVFVMGGIGAIVLGYLFHIIALNSAKISKNFLRFEQDIPLTLILFIVVILFLILWLVPLFDLTFVESLLVVMFSVFFVAVSARMVGLIGTTNQPVSGMTITALLFLTLSFVFLGHNPSTVKMSAIMAGAVVCIAIATSGDLSQDLKTGALIGATPWKVELAQISGLLVSSVRSGFILLLLYWAYGFGNPTPQHPNPLEAPQAQLMAKLVEGASGGSLPWFLLFLGGAIGLICEMIGVSALAFSIGLYLPITNWPMIVIGGLIAWLAKKGRQIKEEEDNGALFSSGLIAGDALMGIFIAGLTVIGIDKYLVLRDLENTNLIFETFLSIFLYG